MKLTICFFAILSMVTFSCQKQNVAAPKQNADKSSPGNLEGSWRMIAVTDNPTGIVMTKPSSVQNDVEITFSPVNDISGTFSGHTPTNDISGSDYSTGTNHLLNVLFLAMTKVAETSWGQEFVDNIRSSLQYGFDSGNNLIIKTTGKTLTFQKL